MGRKKGRPASARGQVGGRQPDSGADQRLAAVLPDVPIIDFVYEKRDRGSYATIKNAFPSERKAWLRAMERVNHGALKAAGFDQDDLASMRNGRVPQNYSVHHIKPKDDGGDNAWENFVLIARSPEHDAVHAYIDPQISGIAVGERRRIRFPDVQPGIYPPVPGLVLPTRSQRATEAPAHEEPPVTRRRAGLGMG